MPSIIKYQFHWKGQGDVLSPAQYVDAYVLDGSSTAISVTVPAGAKIAVFSSTSNFYVNFQGAVSTIPGADITDGSASELNPVARDVSDQTSFSINSNVPCIVTIAYFA